MNSVRLLHYHWKFLSSVSVLTLSRECRNIKVLLYYKLPKYRSSTLHRKWWPAFLRGTASYQVWCLLFRISLHGPHILFFSAILWRWYSCTHMGYVVLFLKELLLSLTFAVPTFCSLTVDRGCGHLFSVLVLVCASLALVVSKCKTKTKPAWSWSCFCIVGLGLGQKM